MLKRDLSMIALVFFITRCFFTVYPIYHIHSFLFSFILTLVGIIVLKNIKKKILQNKWINTLYLLIMIYLFVIILII